MKKTSFLSFWILLLLGGQLTAQNLVSNPGFEMFSPCPNLIDQMNRATGWSSYSKTPDYFHNCANDTLSCAVPKNLVGYQYPHGGDAYAGFWPYASNSFYREIIGSKLITPLAVGSLYRVSFWVAFSDHVAYGKVATNNLGVKFSMIPFSVASPAPINNISHVYTKKVITDTLNWTKISGTFIADSAYEYIMLGNFFDDAHTDTIRIYPTPAWFSYYFLDDIEVIKDQVQNINEFVDNEIKVLHTFSNSNFTILNPKSKLIQVTIFDLQGRKVDQFDLTDTKVTHDINWYQPGLYLLQMDCGNDKIREKIIKQY